MHREVFTFGVDVELRSYVASVTCSNGSSSELPALTNTESTWPSFSSTSLSNESMSARLAVSGWKDRNGLLYTESLGLALAVHLLGQYPAPLRLPRGLSKPQLRRVMAYIEDHLEHPLSLARPPASPGAARRTSRPCSSARRGSRCTPTSCSAGWSEPRRCCTWRVARQSGGARRRLRTPEPHGTVHAARPRGDAHGRGARRARPVSGGTINQRGRGF